MTHYHVNVKETNDRDRRFLVLTEEGARDEARREIAAGYQAEIERCSDDCFGSRR